MLINGNLLRQLSYQVICLLDQTSGIGRLVYLRNQGSVGKGKWEESGILNQRSILATKITLDGSSIQRCLHWHWESQFTVMGVRFVRVSFSEVLHAHTFKSSHLNKAKGCWMCRNICCWVSAPSSATTSSVNKVPFSTVPASSPTETYDNSWAWSWKNHKEMVSWGTWPFL